MIVGCQHCNQPILLAWIQPDEYRAVKEILIEEISKKLKYWATKKEEFSLVFP